MTKRVQQRSQDSLGSAEGNPKFHSLPKMHLISNVEGDMRNGRRLKSSPYESKDKNIIVLRRSCELGVHKSLLVIVIPPEP